MKDRLVCKLIRKDTLRTPVRTLSNPFLPKMQTPTLAELRTSGSRCCVFIGRAMAPKVRKGMPLGFPPYFPAWLTNFMSRIPWVCTSKHVTHNERTTIDTIGLSFWRLSPKHQTVKLTRRSEQFLTLPQYTSLTWAVPYISILFRLLFCFYKGAVL